MIEPNCLERGWGVGNLFYLVLFFEVFLFERRVHLEVALSILHTLKYQRISVSSISYHAAIGACRRAQQWHMAIQLLADAVDHLGSRLKF